MAEEGRREEKNKAGGRKGGGLFISTTAALLSAVYILRFCRRIYLEGKRGLADKKRKIFGNHLYSS